MATEWAVSVLWSSRTKCKNDLINNNDLLHLNPIEIKMRMKAKHIFINHKQQIRTNIELYKTIPAD